MTCENCEKLYPGKCIKVNNLKDLICSDCGKKVDIHKFSSHKKWDTYFYKICKAVATKSPCLSRKIGAILVKDKVVVATGFNGPARGIPHCGKDRFENDETLRWAMRDILPAEVGRIATTCPRQLLDYKSGEGLHLCSAEHAERNCIASAARVGVSVKGTTLYMNCCLPCKNCITLLINAGISEIVVEDVTHYDKYSEFIYKHCSIKLRKFEL